MKVMVTGGDGYIGSHCVLTFLDSGYDVLTFDNHSTGHIQTSENISGISTEGRFLGTLSGDLLNVDDINRAFEENDIDAVIHFAAFSQVAESMKRPNIYYRNNVCGTMNLLDAMKDHGVDKIVFSSTAATYGEPEYTPIDEDHPQRPINPYGRTKLAVEGMMDDYDLAYGIRSVRLRYFNVAGADSGCRVGEWHDPETHLIPNILLTLTGEKEYIEVFGTDYDTPDGTCIRDYIHVNDLADAHLRAVDYLMKGGSTECFNLGTGLGLSVREILETAEKVTGRKIPVRYGPRREGDPPRLIANPKKAREILGWEARCKDAGAIVETAWKWMTGPRHGHY